MPTPVTTQRTCPLKYHVDLQSCLSHWIHAICVVCSFYCLTKISIRAKRSISRVFSLFIVPSPFFVHCPYKGRINRAESVLTGLKPYSEYRKLGFQKSRDFQTSMFSIFTRQMFEIRDFQTSVFPIFTIGEYRKHGCLETSDFLKSQFSIFTRQMFEIRDFQTC